LNDIEVSEQVDRSNCHGRSSTRWGRPLAWELPR